MSTGTRSAVANWNVSLTGIISNLLDGDETGTSNVNLGDTLIQALTTGTSASQLDRIWSDKARAITSGTSEDIDLFDFGSIDTGAGPGNDALGLSLALLDIVAILIVNASASSGTLIVGAKGDATEWESLFTDASTVKLHPNSFLLAGSPADSAWVVADGSNHVLKFAASGGDLNYGLHIFGRSA